MALKVKSEKIKTNGKIAVFFIFFFVFLVIFAVVLAVALFAVGKFNMVNLVYFYKIFFPGTVILPLIISLTTVLGFKRSVMRITPAKNVNMDKLHEHFIKLGYKIVEDKPNYIKFHRTSFISRLFWLNLDQPVIEKNENEVTITLKKYTEISITPLLTYGKHFEITSDNQ